jgi:hypothetical protein
MEIQSPGGRGEAGPESRFPPGSPCGALVAASRELRRAVGSGAAIPAADVADAVTAALRELYLTVADYDGSPLREQLEARRGSDPRHADEVDDRLEVIEVWLEPVLGENTPALPDPDGTGRAFLRSQRRLFGDQSARR